VSFCKKERTKVVTKEGYEASGFTAPGFCTVVERPRNTDLEAIQAMQATCLPIEANGYIQVIEATCLPATPEEAKLRLSRRLLRLLCIEATRLPARYPRTQLL